MLQSLIKVAIIVLSFKIVWMEMLSKCIGHRNVCTPTFNKESPKLTQYEFLEKNDLHCCKNILVSDHNIHFIQKGLFSKFVELVNLSLHNLPLEGEAIKNSLGKRLNLTHLRLENVGLNNTLLESLLPSLPKTLKLLSLMNNSLTYFSTNFISNTTVKTLDLSQNQNITMMLDKEALSLTHLDLSHSNCEWKTSQESKPVCKIPNLLELNFAGNRLNLSTFDNRNDENCFWFLISLDLSLCDLTEPITNESFSFFPNLTSLNLDGISNIEQFPSFQNTERLTKLSLNDVKYFVNPTLKNMNIFKNLHKLRRLEMQYWELSLWGETELTVLFSPMIKTLEHLDLKSTGISTIPLVIKEMDELTKLILTSNNISSWSSISENTNKNLKALFMEWNLIETVDPHSIPKRVFDLSLEGNPFLCTCELMPYKNWVKERKLTKIIKDWASKYRCSKPHQWAGKTLDKFRPKITDCQEFNAYVITAIVLCFLMVIIVIATNIYSRRRKQNILKKFQYTHDSSEKRKLLSSS